MRLFPRHFQVLRYPIMSASLTTLLFLLAVVVLSIAQNATFIEDVMNDMNDMNDMVDMNTNSSMDTSTTKGSLF